MTANDQVYTVYKSSMENHKMITPTGGTLLVKNYQFATYKPEIIAWLDSEIAAGFPYLKKIGTKTAEELDPMYEYKQAAIAEYKEKEELALETMTAEELAEKAAKLEARARAKAEKQKEASKVSTSDTGKLKPASTVDLSHLKAKSNSK